MSFHVPHLQRVTRDMHPLMGTDVTYGNNGAFIVDSPEPGWALYLICSDGQEPDATGDLRDWEHVSISARSKGRTRTPNWKEMCHAKALCWDGEDVVVQFHPRESEYVNIHPHVLHLWRWKAGVFPTPPTIAV